MSNLFYVECKNGIIIKREKEKFGKTKIDCATLINV